MDNNSDVMGVYSYSSEHEYITGERVSRFRHGTYWYVRRIDEDTYEVRSINAHHVPSGPRHRISRSTLLKHYTPELNYYESNTLPCLETLQKKVRKGRRYFNLGQLTEAENAFAQAVIMQDDSIPANMGLSQVYAEQKEFTKLRAVLDKLLNNDDMFLEEQRHRFNEFGIQLRKQELYDDAVRFYTKALEVNDMDENLHFNIARAYHGKKQIKKCREHLDRALELAPEMPEALGFLRAMESGELDNEETIAQEQALQAQVDNGTQAALPPKKVAKNGKENGKQDDDDKDDKKPPKSHGKIYVLDF